MWILGISALVGNLAVAVFRFNERSKSETHTMQSILIGNLAMSDFLMGVYMIVLAGADVYFGDQYFVYSSEWRAGIVCKFAGFLSLLSSEASVFFITFISVERFISVGYPFSRYRLSVSRVRVVVVGIWSLALAISVVPIIFAGPESEIYDLSDVCIGLPLITRPSSYQILESDIGNPLSEQSFALPVPSDSKPAWYYSIALFLGLNLLCFVVIFLCYVKIFLAVRLSRKAVARSKAGDEQMKLALRMAAIVGTDFCCWLPVILMGILSQTGTVVVPLEMYTWSVVFIIPINSSLNPYLYTIAAVASAKREVTSQVLSSEGGTIKKASTLTSTASINLKNM